MREISRLLLLCAEARYSVGVIKSPWLQESGIRIGLLTKRDKISRLLEFNELCLEVAHGTLKKWIKRSWKRNRDTQRLVIFKR